MATPYVNVCPATIHELAWEFAKKAAESGWTVYIDLTGPEGEFHINREPEEGKPE